MASRWQRIDRHTRVRIASGARPKSPNDSNARTIRTIRTPLTADPATGRWDTGGQSGSALLLIQPDATLGRLAVDVSLKGGVLFDGACVFRARIEYRDHHRWDTSHDFSVEIDPPRAASITLEVDFGGEVAGGTLTQWCRAPWTHPSTGAAGIVEGFGPSWTIAGVNPDPRDVLQRLGRLELQAVAFQESAFQQFRPDGSPKFGPPNGYGVMQIDNSPPPTSRQIWDWKANVDDGIRRVSGAGGTYALAKGFPSRVRARLKDTTIPDFSEQELWMEAWQRYNGGWAKNTDPGQGAYWRWSRDERRWVAHPPNTYAQSVSKIAARVAAGNPPPGWPLAAKRRVPRKKR